MYAILKIMINTKKVENNKKHIKKVDFPIETKRLLIRPVSLSDASLVHKAILETYNDLKRWLSWIKKKPTLNEIKKNLKKARSDYKKLKDIRLNIFDKETKDFIGVSGLHRIDWSVPKFEIAYWCRKKYQKKGYITEAVKTISQLALNKLKARRVEILIDEKNKKSDSIPKRLKFKREGTLRNHSRNPRGQLRNLIIYSKIK
jgi:RimJ/RimL family protein N-acetyltransferase